MTTWTRRYKSGTLFGFGYLRQKLAMRDMTRRFLSALPAPSCSP
eukprot:CAMPEP_0181175042 /NCGR_PEP_ID=MMETSP1096-20121128/3863_1 /TAXON_ID=156174 ORGANISM="Chrysochromulina ericina, Strain CCMP281" /NCGR_SAMPLE_ID=MMETSP1096 /ASSEMBLY_ACC=CAM_ASM_000453 /LENGTH=43 /DNA_ID= /DNA_START= /DNA_END= /DNA_ORIENTATION=